MELIQLKEQFAKRVASMFVNAPTISDVSDKMVDSGLVEEKRLRQFLAVSEFYEKYANTKKSELIETLSIKYGVSERLLYGLVTDRAKFKI